MDGTTKRRRHHGGNNDGDDGEDHDNATSSKRRSTSSSVGHSRRRRRRRGDAEDAKEEDDEKYERHGYSHRSSNDKDSKHSHDNDDDDDDGSSSTRIRTGRKSRDHHRSSSRRHRRHHSRKGDSSFSAAESDSEAQGMRGRRSSNSTEKKKQRKRKKKHLRRHYSSDIDSVEKKKKQRKSRDRHDKRTVDNHDNNDNSTTNNNNTIAKECTEAIYNLLSHFPIMAEQLPIMLIKLSTSTGTIDLSNVTNSTLKLLLSQVFSSLSWYDIQMRNDGNLWYWRQQQHQSQAQAQALQREGGGDKAVFIKIVRALLNNEIGITINAIEKYEQDEEQQQQRQKQQNQQLGYNNHAHSEVLSRRVKGPTLPPPKTSVATTTTNTTTTSAAAASHNSENDSDDDDDGPAPAGSEMSRHRIIQQHYNRNNTISKADLKRIVIRRQLEMDMATGKVPKKIINDEIKKNNNDTLNREEWMMTPGANSFLNGVLTKKSSSNSSKPSLLAYKDSADQGNKLKKGEEGISPEIQAEINQLIQYQEESTQHGSKKPSSLMDIHRAKKIREREEKEEQMRRDVENKNKKNNNDGGDWTWSREKDLDSGRRVDKNALNVIMGGADGNLQDKFARGSM